ncbi:RFX-type winged-helix domain-containing protein [Fusarium falciforme]|uniref:RFX-type winged-helix domain-containing protein n=1 Tax=Fusarium falciforme TaxID=195108 RepID=UPI0023009F38|nr:RFX-type winged-helix domain-containing protein [Fusarium falciforme]WAO93702.1 RFX-type winged-helix domain-containing protein [Fusarium falciforme]
MEQIDNQAARARKRPLSRASTTSINSVPNQSTTLDQSGFANASDMYPGQWMSSEHAHAQAHAHAHSHSKDMGVSQLSPEDMILQAASHMQGTGQDFSMDTSMSAPMGHPMSYQQKHPMQRHPLPAEYTQNASFTEGSQMMDRDENGEAGARAAAGAAKPASTRSSANNELEMRQLFSAHRHRTLQEVAGELHGNERGPNSERTRQVFAMLWINSVCAKGKGSVPRGRVYANYASRCATERITVLNPASFGKLVRVLFPGLKTRRLGVRGESKYHYVNFTLIDDEPVAREPSVQPTRPQPEATSMTQSFNTVPAPSHTNLSQGALPSPHIGTEPKSSSSHPDLRSHSIYNQPDLASLDHLHTTTTKTQLELAFPPEVEEAFDMSEPLPLPQIESYLPHGTDPDAAKSLSALYRSHCTSLVECIRYCREKNFFHLYTSFQGTLTMPVQKLFGNPALAPWIEECDFVLYQRMMRIVSGLTLQVVPKPVLDTLRTISERLVMHIRDSFQGQPQHVVRAKEAPAAIFAGLLDRALRTNLTAHAAANMLSNPANRDQMYLDWITMIRPRKLAECVPTRGMDDVVNVLLTEMRDLLDPVKVPWEMECLTIYGDISSRSNRETDGEGASAQSGQNVLDRWVDFLRSLPRKFPYASHADIVSCVERIGTAVMRDLTLSQGKSFGSWWVTKAFLDEMMCFMVAQGGFMKQKMSQTTGGPTPTPPPATQETAGSRQNSRYNGSAEELGVNTASQNQGERAPFPPAKTNQNSMGMSGNDGLDDSGIGIRTPEEDFPMDKFSFTGSENPDHGLLTGTELDPGAGL